MVALYYGVPCTLQNRPYYYVDCRIRFIAVNMITLRADNIVSNIELSSVGNFLDRNYTQIICCWFVIRRHRRPALYEVLFSCIGCAQTCVHYCFVRCYVSPPLLPTLFQHYILLYCWLFFYLYLYFIIILMLSLVKTIYFQLLCTCLPSCAVVPMYVTSVTSFIHSSCLLLFVSR
jgi:hypothetical protein